MKEITHIDHLQPFFESMAAFHYLGDVARASVDAEAVEALLDNEVCVTVPTYECFIDVWLAGQCSTIFVWFWLVTRGALLQCSFWKVARRVRLTDPTGSSRT
jgi:hypothetical protein